VKSECREYGQVFQLRAQAAVWAVASQLAMRGTTNALIESAAADIQLPEKRFKERVYAATADFTHMVGVE